MTAPRDREILVNMHAATRQEPEKLSIYGSYNSNVACADGNCYTVDCSHCMLICYDWIIL